MDYFTTIVDFQPILVGAGCLALGYVYGRHCRSLSEMQASAPTASEEACCAESQSNTYQEIERCKCCMSAPAALDSMALENEGAPKHSHDLLDDDAAERGAERPERCTSKRDLGQLGVSDRHACHMEELEGAVAVEAPPGLPQPLSNTLADKNLQAPPAQILKKKEERMRAHTPYKKHKCTPGPKESSWSVQKDKGEMQGSTALRDPERVEDGVVDPAAVPWSQEVFNQRIDYFKKVISETGASIDALEEGRKLISPSKKLKRSTVVLTTSSADDDAKDTSSDSRKSTSNTLARSSSGLGVLATPIWAQANCSLGDKCNSPMSRERGHYNSGPAGEAVELTTSLDHPTTENATERGPIQVSTFVNGKTLEGNVEDDIFLDAVRDADSVTRYEFQRQPDVVSAYGMDHGTIPSDLEEAMEDVPLEDHQSSVPQLDEVEVFRRQTPLPTEHQVQDRCLEESGMRKLQRSVPVDKVIKAEIYEVCTEADYGKVSFEEIVSLLEERLHVDLRQNKAHIASLVREVLAISKLLEAERALEEYSEQQETAMFDACSLNN